MNQDSVWNKVEQLGQQISVLLAKIENHLILKQFKDYQS